MILPVRSGGSGPLGSSGANRDCSDGAWPWLGDTRLSLLVRLELCKKLIANIVKPMGSLPQPVLVYLV